MDIQVHFKEKGRRGGYKKEKKTHSLVLHEVSRIEDVMKEKSLKEGGGEVGLFFCSFGILNLVSEQFGKENMKRTRALEMTNVSKHLKSSSIPQMANAMFNPTGFSFHYGFYLVNVVSGKRADLTIVGNRWIVLEPDPIAIDVLLLLPQYQLTVEVSLNTNNVQLIMDVIVDPIAPNVLGALGLFQKTCPMKCITTIKGKTLDITVMDFRHKKELTDDDKARGLSLIESYVDVWHRPIATTLQEAQMANACIDLIIEYVYTLPKTVPIFRQE